jgi:DNA replication and repair protein RecF
VVRGTAERDGRELLIEAEIRVRGRGRVSVNRQPLRRAADLVGALVVSVFSPDDLDLVKGGPSSRRRYLDDLLVALHLRNDALRRDLERILRQRTALLRDCGGRLSPALAPTLDVWDSKLATVGDALGAARADLVARLEPELTAAYAGIAGPDARAVGVAYDAPWRTIGLAAALATARAEELRRGVCLVGPHRDELLLTISSMPARTHASQGEQRSMALALRLAGHRVVGESAGESPVLLLDDVFSELDDTRSQALLDHLPPGQAILTTTGAIPPGATPALVVQATTAHLTPHPHPASISDVVANGAPPAPDAPKTSPPTPNPTDIGAPMSPTDQFAPKTAAPTPARTDSGAPVSPADHFAPKSVTGPVSRERPA